MGKNKWVAVTNTCGWWYECGATVSLLGAKRSRGATEIYREEDCFISTENPFGFEMMVPKPGSEPCYVKHKGRWTPPSEYIRMGL